ncbi:phosphonate C-P lyase system protein PhnH [Tropicibacter sp. R15_0]|uniref:phosphonate C-P lyase system protein PhnH n=1 Tax=Tropicibacter sp. R15_0 TaxID=2821101 RepID=UPI001ADC7069|nr:phosphonate C-P lyase system protein PhnH [Tropicibacter sp. R15_0]MBO9465149.1 phosphonate C-P lyase system protein PhnH [Tropicibacter sp. R15_0]
MSQSAPLRSVEEIEANASFDALLWALSRPGQIQHLPKPGEAALIDALIDRECRVYSADPLLVPQVMRSGAEIADMASADHVFLAIVQDSEVLKSLQLGSDLYPDEGATVIIRCKLGAGPRLRLSGPGVNGTCDLQVAGLPDGFWQTRAQVMRYPTGFELILLDGERLVALPRSTTVEVL